MATVQKDFGTTPEGQRVSLFALTNNKGMKAAITNYGGIVVSLSAPDRAGRFDDVVLGFDTLEEYCRQTYYFGCVVGRFSGRIASGEFDLDNKKYKLAVNSGPNHLHGGVNGFHRKVWDAIAFRGKDMEGVRLSRVSRDGEEGYPGNCSVSVSYELTDKNEFKIAYAAISDKPTIINLTNHSYFNLAGASAGDALSHTLSISADSYCPQDERHIPTGEIASVEGTPFDFRKEISIGSRMEEPNEQLRIGQGYDHDWVLNTKGNGMSVAAALCDPLSGRKLEILTTEPAVHFYSANYLDATIYGKGHKKYGRRHAVCLETQHFPDAPNKPGFPSTALRPGQEFNSTTVYRFSVK